MSTQYLSSHYGPSQFLSNHYGRVAIIPPPFTPEPVHPPGSGYSEADRRRWILEEDDLLMAIVIAFLKIKDD